MDFDRNGDEYIRRHFPYREMTPEEYAARRSHLIGCYSYRLFCYRDPEIGWWARRLGEILTDPDEMEKCRQEYLSREELEAVHREIEDIESHGL